MLDSFYADAWSEAGEDESEADHAVRVYVAGGKRLSNLIITARITLEALDTSGCIDAFRP